MGGFMGNGTPLAALLPGGNGREDQVEAQNSYLAQQQEIRARQQRDLLARQMATARARLAAGGLGVGSGSAQALLSGLTRETETAIADDAALVAARQNNAASALNGSSADGLRQGLAIAEQGWSMFKTGK